jgi:site-specific recombinase XerC
VSHRDGRRTVTVIPLPRPNTGVPLVVAVDRFLERFRDAPTTAATYAETLSRLRAAAGDQSPVAALTPEIYAQTMARWDTAAAATFNKHLAALNSFAAYCRRQEWLTTDPGRHLERRKTSHRRDKAIPRARLERLFTDDRNDLRERVLWRMLYSLNFTEAALRIYRNRSAVASMRSAARASARSHWATVQSRARARWCRLALVPLMSS